MKRILIWRGLDSAVNIYAQTNYRTIAQDWPAGYPNWGNKVWYQGLVSTVDCNDNMLCFRTKETVNEINESFDLIIYPMANFFHESYNDAMMELSKVFRTIKIPVYILACGCQASSYDLLDDLVEKTREPAKRFISSIYETGGEFALRGNFTKRYFDKLGFYSAVVTGCPSLYQCGRDLRIDNTKIDFSKVRPVLNGRIQLIEGILERFSNSIYIDQDIFGDALFDQDFFLKWVGGLKSRAVFMRNYRPISAKLLAENRIKMIADVNDWYWYLREERFDYSFGSRIHGNIMSVLSGIPATVAAIDTRTQEMAEFYDIPFIKVDENQRITIKELEHLYYEADYTEFNKTFAEKFDRYERFLQQHGIVTAVNEDNRFLRQENAKREFENTVNQESFGVMAGKLRKEQPLLAIFAGAMNLKDKF